MYEFANELNSMASYFFLDLEIPTIHNETKTILCESGNTKNSLPKFGFIDMLKKVHGYNVFENNRWFQTKHQVKIKKRVSFKPTEIYGRESILPYCRDKYNHTVKSGYLHASNCSNFLQESPEILGQYTWMNREFLIKARLGENM